MKFDVELMPPFHFVIIYVVLATIGLAICILALVFVFWKKKTNTERVEPKPKQLDVAAIKQKYLTQLDELSRRADMEKPRKNYQELSFLMRSFVFEMTGVKVTKYALQEIDPNEFPELYQMMKEFYSPEFSREGVGDLMLAIEKVKRGIETWK